MKGTKLWQAAGSPIIQGRSRRQRPSWQQWVPASLASIAVAVWYLFSYTSGPIGSAWALVGAVVGALLGALVGVTLARAMGWRFPSLWGTIIGVGGAAALFALGAALLSA